MENLNLDQPKPHRKRRTKAEIKAAQGAADMAWLEELTFGTGAVDQGRPEDLEPVRVGGRAGSGKAPAFRSDKDLLVAGRYPHHRTVGEMNLHSHNVLCNLSSLEKPTLEERVGRALGKLATIISHTDSITAKLRNMHAVAFGDPVLERQLRSLRDQVDIINVECRRIRNNLKDT